MPNYSDYTPGTFSYTDIINSGSGGFVPSDYGAIGSAFGFSNENTGPSTPGLWDALAPFNPYYTPESKIYTDQGFTPEYNNLLNSLQITNRYGEDGTRYWDFTKQGEQAPGYTKEFKQDDALDKFMGAAFPMVIGSMVGGGLSGLFGGGITGNALGYGLSSGGFSAGMGGDFGKGALQGALSGGLMGMAQGTPSVIGNNPSAYVPAQSGMSFSNLAGIQNPTLGGMFNRSVGTTLGSLASGKNAGEALQNGLLGAGVAGINSLGSQGMSFLNKAFSSLLPSGNTEPDFSVGDTSYGSNYMAPGQSALRTAGLFPEMSNVPPSSSNFQTLETIGLPSLDMNPYANASYGEGGYKPNGVSALEQAGLRNEMSYAPPGTVGDTSMNYLNPSYASLTEAKQNSSFNLPSSVSSFLSSAGNYTKNNLGDLATTLYGIYNNRKQQKALGQQLSSLQGLYGQNSPYAQQLRNTLNAKAAQTGRRSNIAGRETQLQAALADRYAQLQPSMLQINQARGQLQNSMGSNTLSMLNKMGAFKSLASLFGGTQPDYNQLGVLEGLR